jgi:hypothetical protein
MLNQQRVLIAATQKYCLRAFFLSFFPSLPFGPIHPSLFDKEMDDAHTHIGLVLCMFWGGLL